MLAKDKHRLKLLEYLGNPENEFLGRLALSIKILGFKQENQIYKIFTPDEMSEIEKEALAIRRKKYFTHLAKIDKAMIKEANNGNDRAAKLCYQRFEDWGEKKVLEGSVGVKIQLVNYSDSKALPPAEKATNVKVIDDDNNRVV